MDERREANECKGRLEQVGFGKAEIFANKVKVTKSDG